MSTLILDVAKETANVTETKDGYRATHVHFVSDPGGQANATVFNALQVPGVPVYGQPHPVIPNIQVVSRLARVLDAKSIEITIAYGIPSEDEKVPGQDDEGEIEYGSVSISKITAFDRNGTRISARYQGLGVPNLPLNTLLITAEEYPEVEYEATLLSARITRRQDPVPRATISALVDHVNDGSWSGDVADSWLCKQIRNMTYRGVNKTEFYFLQSPDLHQVEVRARYNGVVPSDIAVGNGIEFWDVYPRANFNVLGITIPQ